MGSGGLVSFGGGRGGGGLTSAGEAVVLALDRAAPSAKSVSILSCAIFFDSRRALTDVGAAGGDLCGDDCCGGDGLLIRGAGGSRLLCGEESVGDTPSASSANVDSEVPAVADMADKDATELSQVRPETLLESDCRGKEDFVWRSN